MSKLYLIINIAVLLGPLALSFDKKVAFFKTWKALFTAQLLMMAIYIPWDMIFTANGVWGFNSNYLTGLTIGNLPLEEVLFFVTVPYACTFIYACLKAYLQPNLSRKWNQLITLILSFIFLGFISLGFHQQYSFYTALASLATLIFFYLKIKDSHFWATFFLSYAIAWLPFLLVNGILTGSFIEDEIVFYNSDHIFNLRIFTIPIEDSVYNFGMLLLTIGVYELFLPKTKKE